jgi:hypothetical protein
MSLQNKTIEAALKNNRPLMLLGKAGTAKTATVNFIAKKLELPVVTLPLAGISPEDIGGLPRPNDTNNPTAFRYLAPEWFEKYKDKPFVLFLDEFNQATIDTMHAMFYLVNDRMTAGQTNPQMRIVAAGNTEEENEFLTPIPSPLRDRFVYQIKWQSDLEASLKFLEEKYKSKEAKGIIEAVRKSSHGSVTARHVEQAIFMAEDDIFDIDRGSELIGSAYQVYIEGLSIEEKNPEDDRLNYLREVKERIKNTFTVIDGKIVYTDKNEILKDLTEEEREIVNA